MPELSVVIPTYDTAAMTLRCCRAVLAALPESSEVIVADDGSRDGTAELLAREVPSVQTVRLETNRGFAAAANCGVAAARGRIILLLNSDAVVEPDALQALVSAFADDPTLGIAGAQLLDDDGTPQWSGGRTPTLPWMIGVVSGAGKYARFFRRGEAERRRPRRLNVQASSPAGGGSVASVPPPRLRQIDWVSGAAIAFRSEVWSAAGPLSERFLFYCQDIEFCLRARAAGWQVRLVDDACVRHALGGTVSAGNPLRHDPERLWADLLTWGAGYYGEAWASRARRVLFVVGAMRIVLRKLRHPWRRDATTGALLRATRRLAQSDS